MSDNVEQSVAITLDEKISIENIDQLHEKLLAIDPLQIKKVTLDVGDVEDVDFVGLQTILSFMKKMDESKVSVEWKNLSIPLYEAAIDIDFCEQLRL